MKRRGKGYNAALAKVDRTSRYPLEEGLRLVHETKRAKFDETVELAVRLGVDPRQADQNIRGTVVLPHGMGKAVRVAAFAKGEKEKAVADYKRALVRSLTRRALEVALRRSRGEPVQGGHIYA